MKEKILAVLQSECPEVDFLASDILVTSGILDSLLLIRIIVGLSERLGITVPYQEINEDNFNSVDAITAMVERLMKG